MNALKVRGSALYVVVGIVALLLLAYGAAPYYEHPQTVLTKVSHGINGDSLLEHTQNATLGFQSIMIITDKNRTDHRDGIALAAGLTGLNVTYVHRVERVDNRTLPLGDANKWMTSEELGNWRAHMNAARTMLENNIASALILEDDADWDVRIKQQMRQLAKATRLLIQPIPNTRNGHLDDTFPSGNPKHTDEHPINLYIHDEPPIVKPKDSPYGDIETWDMFWVGHCGNEFPTRKATPELSLGRAVIVGDETVPGKQQLARQAGSSELSEQYEKQTRVVSRARDSSCAIGYALSLPGARKLLYELSVKRFDQAYDLSLRRFCDGSESAGRDIHMCFAVQPELFQKHSLQAEASDQVRTGNVRWSTRLNLEKLMHGHVDFIDSRPDNEPDD